MRLILSVGNDYIDYIIEIHILNIPKHAILSLSKKDNEV